uniref:DUF4258 domain-containing protein n=1 Tax=Angiostrongylus cantonensis TaxID=6313 RepID=A0A0K0CTK6_ANGCA
MHIHSGYNPSDLRHDIAVAEISENIYVDGVPICMPTERKNYRRILWLLDMALIASTAAGIEDCANRAKKVAILSAYDRLRRVSTLLI